jgi:hypothetical protein
MAMKRNIYMVGCFVAAIGTLHPAFAADAKKDAVHAPSTSSPTMGPTGPMGATTPPNFHMPPAALQREMHALERSKHLLEMSAQNDHSSHEAIAARHLQMAINELKLEAMKSAQAKRAGEPTKGAGAATPVVRK